MSWNVEMDCSDYGGNVAPYNSAGSFIDFFAGLTYDHVNFIFAGSSPMQLQDSAYSPGSMGYYKYGYSEPVATQYYNDSQFYEAYDLDEYSRRPSEFASTMIGERIAATSQHSEGMSNTNVDMRSRDRDCPRSQPNSQDHQIIWQDTVDPDSMSYEELLELGEVVGTQSRGLSQEQISMLPVSKFKCCFLRRKKYRHERCVICQMEYKRGNRLITLPCKHKYHVGCGSKWLSINKACPICYTEVFVDATKK